MNRFSEPDREWPQPERDSEPREDRPATYSRVPVGANWQVTVQQPVKLPTYGAVVPGYVQIDDLSNGNRWSKSPERLRREGWDVPDFSRLPSGRYPWERACRMLEQEVEACQPI